MADEEKRRGLSHPQFAEVIGISVPSTKKYVKGKVPNPPEEKLRGIASRLGWNYAWLIDGVGPQYAGKREAGGEELINVDILEAVISLIEEHAERDGRRPTPLIYARVVAHIYSIAIKWPAADGSLVDPETVRSALRLVT